MATPSVKEMQLKITKIVEEKSLLVKENKKLKEEIKSLESKNNSLHKTVSLSRSDMDTKKKILSYFAKGFQYSVILDKMRFNDFETDIQSIKDICLNIEDLDSELVLHYTKERKSYEESIKINPEILKNDMIVLYDLLINEATMDLQDCNEVEERRRIREEIRHHMDKKNNVLKNIVEDTNKDIVEIINSNTDRIEKANQSITFSVKEEFVN